MDTDYRMVRAADAPALLDFMKRVAGDTDNLALSVAETEDMEVHDEKLFITELRNTPSVFALAITDGVITGTCNIRIPVRVRTRHRGELAIVVRKEYWGTGIAQHLFEFAVSEAKERGVVKLQVDVRADNERAKAFYKRNGFVSEGVSPMLLCVDGEYVDGEHMGCIL